MAAIGIMGGTFNPIHVGHINIAQAAYEQYSLDEVWFMPNHIPGYKSGVELVSGRRRLAMVNLAISDIPYFKASDYELNHPGTSYTSQTLESLSSLYKEHSFYFIMGADSLAYFDKWKNPEKILRYAKILVAPRGSGDRTPLYQMVNKANCDYGGEFFYSIECSLIPCSSHEIREAFHAHNKESISKIEKFLPKEVFEYITGQHLYQL